MNREPAATREAAAIIELVTSWARTLSDPVLSEHTLLALGEGTAWYATRGKPVQGVITLVSASLPNVGLVEMAAPHVGLIGGLWRAKSPGLIDEATTRGFSVVEVVDPAESLDNDEGRVIRVINRMKTVDPVLRPAVPLDAFESGDEADLVAIINQAFAGHPENGNWSQADVEKRQRLAWFEPKGLLVKRTDEAITGFCWTKVHPDGVGEIYLIAVHPDYQGQGIGRELLNAGLDHLVTERKCDEIVVYTESDNSPAIRLYTDHGFKVDRIDRRIEIEV